MFKKSTTRPICKYYNGCKKNQHVFTKFICKYYNECKRTNNYLWDLYVGIAYLKMPYGNSNKKDVSMHNVHFDFCRP
jgi:hypothetical protein